MTEADFAIIEEIVLEFCAGNGMVEPVILGRAEHPEGGHVYCVKDANGARDWIRGMD